MQADLLKTTHRPLLAAAALWLLAFAASAQNIPTIIVQPVSQATAAAATVTLTVSTSGAGTPLPSARALPLFHPSGHLGVTRL